MPGVFPSQLPVPFLEHFQHVAIADLGARERNSQFFQRALEREIGHQGPHHSSQAPAFCALAGDHVQQLIAVVERAVAVGHEHSVPVAVERDAEVRLVLSHRALQGRGVGRAGPVVDVEAVGAYPDRNDIGAQLVEHVRGDMVSGAVGAVDDDLQPAQVERGREGALAEFDVAARGVVHPPRLAELGRFLALDLATEALFDLRFHFVRQLAAVGGKKLDAVVLIGVVRGTPACSRNARVR